MRTNMRTAASVLVCLALIGAAGCGSPRSPQDLSGQAGWRGAAPNTPDSFRFVILGDRTGGHEEGVWEKAVVEVNRLKPDFVVCVGDLIEGYKEDEALIAGQMDEFESLTSCLDAPFFYCPGNHDVTGTVPRTLYTTRRGVHGRTYYSFNYRSCHFVIVDSEAIVSNVQPVAQDQWTWLEKDLASARGAAHVFILFHHPIYDQPQWATLRALLDPARTTIVNGHLHRLSYDVEDDIPYYILSATAAKTDNKREIGEFQSFAHVVVDRGSPTASIIPVGQVLPHNFVDRHLTDVLGQMAARSQLSGITPAGTETVLQLAGPEEGQATATLTWTAEAGWFDGDVPSAETVQLGTGAVVTRKYHVNATKPQTPAPVLNVAYNLDAAGRTAQRSAKLTLPVIATMDVRRVSGIRIDGDLADWSGVPAVTTDTRTRVTYHPETWTGPEDATLTTRLGFDDKRLYLAFEVTDDAIVSKSPTNWEQDSLEIFWDPRPEGQRTAQFQGPCRQIFVPLPQTPGRPQVTILPANSIAPAALDIACVRRQGGYVVELAVLFEEIGEGWRPATGTTLHIEAIVNDLDLADGKETLSNLVLSGQDNASRRTEGYARLTFAP